MTSVADPAVLAALEERLRALRPGDERRWGTLSAGEMLCHLADAADSVLSSPDRAPGRTHRLRKWVALRSKLAWPHGLPTPASVDPRKDGSRPTDFEADRVRAVAGLRAVARAEAGELPASHSAFGAMTADDWYRWAYRHTDHHLKQFGR